VTKTKKIAIILWSVIAGLVLIGSLAIALAPDEPASDTNTTASDAPDELVTAVTAIAPETNLDKILSNSENVCLDIEQGKDDATLARNAALRFEVDEAEGPALVDAIRPHCDTIRGE
jgi:hypothetical protein